MQAFENDHTDMVKNIKFMKHQDNFHEKIINDTKKYTTENKYLYSLTKQPIYILQVSQTAKS